jgi:hypothetical protein
MNYPYFIIPDIPENYPYFIIPDIPEISPPGACDLHQRGVSAATEAFFVASFSCYPAAQTPKWRTPHCQLFMTAYLVYCIHICRCSLTLLYP